MAWGVWRCLIWGLCSEAKRVRVFVINIEIIIERDSPGHVELEIIEEPVFVTFEEPQFDEEPFIPEDFSFKNV